MAATQIDDMQEQVAILRMQVLCILLGQANTVCKTADDAQMQAVAGAVPPTTSYEELRGNCAAPTTAPEGEATLTTSVTVSPSTDVTCTDAGKV